MNIMNQYIDITKKQLDTYFKIIFDSKYNKRYTDVYIEKYVNSRYLNFFGDSENTIRKIVLDELKKTQEYIISSSQEDAELIEQMYIFLCYFLYFDNLVYCKDLYEKAFKVEKLRNKLLNKFEENFQNKIYNAMIEYDIEKDKLLDRVESNEFSIKISNYKTIKNTYKVSVEQDIKFPMEYSKLAIDKVFNSGIINENKLIVEYHLISVQIIKDIIKQNFKKQYIVEFAETLLKKPQKIRGILNIIDNAAIQDKVSLKIRNEYYLENKEEIYDLMREGFRFAIVLDNSFEVNYKNIENLKMFKFVIINNDSKDYDEIIKMSDEIRDNIIVV